MPTILLYKGWRVFFYANERQEPAHAHCAKGSARGKFWLLADTYDIRAAYVRSMTRQEEREIRKILFDHFDELIERWNAFKEEQDE